MHALMAAVLLRMTRLDPFNANTEPEPPDRKFAQVKQGMGRSEGHAVVAANAGRQAALANLAGTPGRVLALHVQDEVFHLEGKLMRIAVGPSAAVRQPLHPTLLVATEDFVACLARDPKLPAEIRHLLAG